MSFAKRAKLAQNEDEDNEAKSTKCLSVSVIVRKIMEHLSNAQLLQVSNLNKLWNFEARSVMRDRGCFIARLKSGHPCQDFLALASQMQLMNVIPFAGISMELNENHIDVCALPSTPKLDSSHYQTLDCLPWKHLAAKFSGHWALDVNCPAFHLVIKVLQKFCGSLEELSLHIEPFAAHSLEQAVQGSKFPRLKTLRYEAESGSPTFNDAHGRFIHAVVSRAEGSPVELHMKKYLSDLDRALEEGNVELIADYAFNPARHFFSENAMAALRLTQCILSFYPQGPHLPFWSFNRIVPVLLRASCSSLTSLHMDLMHALPLMCYGISLESLVDLRINVGFPNSELAQPQMLTLLKAFDFTRIFPRLNRARVLLHDSSIPQSHIREFLEQANALRRDPAGDGANIKHLSFSSTMSPQNAPFLFFAQVFPKIEKLDFQTYAEREDVFGLIWKHWVELKELEVRVSFRSTYRPKKDSPYARWTKSLESEFCGIFPEEVAELREKDDEFLQAVNIVPVMPAITCMRELRTFKMLCIDKSARCPKLSVTLETNSNELAKALSHMKPYASVVVNEAMAKDDFRY